MKTECIALSGVGLTLALAAAAVPVPSLTPGIVDWRDAFEPVLWTTTAPFGLAILLWAVLTYVVGAGYEPPEPVHGAGDVQVRILTVDAESVVRWTADSLPGAFDDPGDRRGADGRARRDRPRRPRGDRRPLDGDRRRDPRPARGVPCHEEGG